MNILLGVLSFFLSLGIYFGVEKFFGHFFPEFITKLNPYPTNDSRWQYYLYETKKCIGMWFPFFFLFYLSHVIALVIETKFPATTNSVFWITLCGLLGGVTIILLIWIIIQYLGDLLYEYGLKGIGERGLNKNNKFFRYYWMIMGLFFFSWLFILPILDNHLVLPENIVNKLVVISYYGFLGMIFLMLGLVGLEIRVVSNIEERLKTFRTFDENYKAWKKDDDKDTESDSEPTPKQLPTMDEVEEAMKGVDLWEVGKTHELIASGRKDRRPWLKPPDPSQDPPWKNPKKRMFWFVIKFFHELRYGK